jgi:hypothetical protein
MFVFALAALPLFKLLRKGEHLPLALWFARSGSNAAEIGGSQPPNICLCHEIPLVMLPPLAQVVIVARLKHEASRLTHEGVNPTERTSCG